MNRIFFLYALMISLLFIFINGYQFNSSDQEEHLPQIYQQFDDELYANDFFLDSNNKTFTVRESYVLFVGTLARIIPLRLLCFILQLACICFAAFGLMKVTQRFGGSSISPFVAPFLACIVFNTWTVGGNTFENSMLISTSLANPLVVFSILFFLQGRTFLSGCTAGVAALFQALMGLHVVILLLFAHLMIAGRKKALNAVRLLGGFVICSAAMLIPIFYKQFTTLNPDPELYNFILFELRNYLHYLPSMFPTNDYVKLGLLVVVAYFVSRWVFLKKRRFLYAFTSGILLSLLLYYVLFDLAGLAFIGKMQWFKSTVLLNVFCCIVLALGVGATFNATIKRLRLSKLIIPITAFGILVLSIPILFSKAIPIDKLQGRYQIGYFLKSDLQLMHEYIENNVGKSEVILTDPTDNSFLCEAKRATPVSYKAIIHEPFYLLEWYERMKTVYRVDDPAPGRFLEQAKDNYDSYLYYDEGNLYGISLRLVDRKSCLYLAKLKDPIHIQGDYGLYPYVPKAVK